MSDYKGVDELCVAYRYEKSVLARLRAEASQKLIRGLIPKSAVKTIGLLVKHGGRLSGLLFAAKKALPPGGFHEFCGACDITEDELKYYIEDEFQSDIDEDTSTTKGNGK